MGDGDALFKFHDPVCRFIRREDKSQREVGGVAQNVNLKNEQNQESEIGARATQNINLKNRKIKRLETKQGVRWC